MQKRVYLIFFSLIFSLMGACVLLPDIPCKTDQDCTNGGLGKYVCFRGLQCVPPWWRDQIEERFLSIQDGSPSEQNVDTTDTPLAPEKDLCVGACQLGATRPCYGTQKGCVKVESTWSCEGICKVGLQTCVLVNKDGCPEWAPCQNQVLPDPSEKCDRLDNNCDGQIDEGCDCKIGDTRACYTKGRGCTKSGESFSCVVPCRSGTQKCVGGAWGFCNDEQGPTNEACDGKDNDCNGLIDDGLSPPLCDKKQGPCLGKVKSCGGEKGWLACSIKEYGADYENNETKCDKIDNDCDGKVDEGCVITIAGTGVDGFQDGSALQAQFTAPFGLAFDGSGSLYISDQKNHRIRILDSLGIVSTFAGTGKPGFLDAAVQYCQFDNPRGLTFDSKGNLYVTDAYNNRIRKIDVQGKVTTFAGSGQSGQTNGPALSASLYLPHFIAFSSGGDVFFTEASTHWIRKISSGGSVSVLAGVASDFGFRDGSRTQSRFGFPYGIVADKSGDLYVADASNSRIRKVDSNGNVTTFAGSGKRGNKDGPALSAEFSFPSSIVIDPKGNFYFVDLDNHQIKKIDTKGMVTTVAGVGSQGFRDGPSEKAMFRAPTSLVIGPDGSLYVTDTGNHRIRKIILP